MFVIKQGLNVQVRSITKKDSNAKLQSGIYNSQKYNLTLRYIIVVHKEKSQENNNYCSYVEFSNLKRTINIDK